VKYEINNEIDRQRLLALIDAAPLGTKVDYVEPKKTRTLSQNNALHLWCRMIGEDLNAAGYDMKKTLRFDADIPWDSEGRNIKKNIWRPVQIAVTGKESTTQPTTAQYTEIFDATSRYLSQRTGVYVPWPSLR
jgi:hypothetical protein